MRTVEIDGRRMRDRASAHAYLARKIGAPTYYGNNLDALRDVLTDCAVPTRYVIRHADAIEESLGAYGAALLRAFRDAAAENELIALEIR